MIIEHECYIGLRDVGVNNLIRNKSILAFLEDTGAIPSDIIGYGSLNIHQTKLSWIILGWKVKLYKRPMYGETIKIKTWSSKNNKFYAYRDFEIFDKNNELIGIATSKWVLLDIEKKSIAPLSEEMLKKYDPVDKQVFEKEPKYKIVEPKKYTNSCEYEIKRNIIDLNNHVHNISYLDIAYEALPEEVYKKADELKNIEISYKKEMKYGEKIKCLYSFENNEHIIIIKDEAEKIIHAMIKLS